MHCISMWGSVWAPDLVKYEGKYYIYFPADNTNYVITSDHIEESWSDPAELKVSMIDPGHVMDEKGKMDCGTFKFVHIWKKVGETWELTRVVSYGH
ncbi:family 43 glycosylhydrolase [Flammeovirgaceae bacterium SG7u.111]|nr:family 43 glycosylhydrolase [Flammeovirgaceae bacterium SG7u.132]WPO37270.1 family 43 glycosylhydrolase [Flammeovirgaceae bacterium SG7u.111]